MGNLHFFVWIRLWDRAYFGIMSSYLYLYWSCGPASVVGIATGYGLDGLGIESRWGARSSAPVQTSPGAQPASCTMGTWFFPGVKSGQGVTLTPHSLLVPWSWKGRAKPLLPLWAVRPVQSLSACTGVHFTFFYLYWSFFWAASSYLITLKTKHYLWISIYFLQHNYKISTNTDTTHRQSLVYTGTAHSASAEMKNVALQLDKYCAISLASHVTWHQTFCHAQEFL